MGLLYLIWVGLYTYAHRRDDARSGGGWTGGLQHEEGAAQPQRLPVT
jgi:hypothetical protein